VLGEEPQQPGAEVPGAFQADLVDLAENSIQVADWA
jgi:hypothetical protein